MTLLERLWNVGSAAAPPYDSELRRLFDKRLPCNCGRAAWHKPGCPINLMAGIMAFAEEWGEIQRAKGRVGKP